MSLQIGRLIRNIGIGRTVGFVKTVARKVYEQIEYFIGNGFRNIILHRAGNKGFTLRFKDGFFLFTHGTAH